MCDDVTTLVKRRACIHSIFSIPIAVSNKRYHCSKEECLAASLAFKSRKLTHRVSGNQQIKHVSAVSFVVNSRLVTNLLCSLRLFQFHNNHCGVSVFEIERLRTMLSKHCKQKVWRWIHNFQTRVGGGVCIYWQWRQTCVSYVMLH